MENQFYCYVLCDPRKPGTYNYGKGLSFEFEPFYVGKGKGKRYSYHTRKVGAGGNNHKNGKIRKILSAGLDVVIHQGSKRFDEASAFAMERKLIKAIGRYDKGMGPLTNLTDGGEGSVDVALSVRKKMSANTRKQLAAMHLVDHEIKNAKVGKGSAKVWAGYTSAERAARGDLIAKGRLAMTEDAKLKRGILAGAALSKTRSQESYDERAARVQAFKHSMASRGAELNAKRHAAISASLNAMTPKAREQRSSKMQAAWSNRKPKTCPHCNASSVNYANMTRWHFDNCKAR